MLHEMNHTVKCFTWLLSILFCCCLRHFTKAQTQYGAYFHKVLFSGTLQRQRHTKVTLRRVTFNALDKLLLHQQASGGTSSPCLPSQHTTAAVDQQQLYFLCVYAASQIVWHGVAAVEVHLTVLLSIQVAVTNVRIVLSSADLLHLHPSGHTHAELLSLLHVTASRPNGKWASSVPIHCASLPYRSFTSHMDKCADHCRVRQLALQSRLLFMVMSPLESGLESTSVIGMSQP